MHIGLLHKSEKNVYTVDMWTYDDSSFHWQVCVLLAFFIGFIGFIGLNVNLNINTILRMITGTDHTSCEVVEGSQTPLQDFGQFKKRINNIITQIQEAHEHLIGNYYEIC